MSQLISTNWFAASDYILAMIEVAILLPMPEGSAVKREQGSLGYEYLKSKWHSAIAELLRGRQVVSHQAPISPQEQLACETTRQAVFQRIGSSNILVRP